jgi:hypothetical protein
MMAAKPGGSSFTCARPSFSRSEPARSRPCSLAVVSRPAGTRTGMGGGSTATATRTTIRIMGAATTTTRTSIHIHPGTSTITRYGPRP